ncbi:MAG: hypothetical protein ACP5O2_04310 [Bacteroidales bacterium]
MSTFILLLQSTIPSLLVLAVAFYFFHASNERFLYQWKETVPLLKNDDLLKTVKSFLEKEEKLQYLNLKRDQRQITLPLRLQAYERLVLLLERISLSSLMLRNIQPEMSVQQFKNALIQNVRSEFEHNLSQQIYLTETTWTLVRKHVEDTLQAINVAASRCEGHAPATLLAAELVSIENEGKSPDIQSVLSKLHAEAQTLLG